MNYIIAVFKSRTETIDFRDKMLMSYIDCRTVNTPMKVCVGCGISASFDPRGYHLAEYILAHSDYRTFVGMYRYDKEGNLVKI